MIIDNHDLEHKIASEETNFFYKDKKDVARLDFLKLATILKNRFSIIIPSNTNEIMIYDKKEGIYVEGKHDVEEEIINLLDNTATAKNTNEVIHFIKGLARKKETDLKKDKFVITLNNGNYNIKTQVFEAHSKEVYTTSKLPINYKPTADCPLIKKFITEIVNEEDVNLLQEMVGYCLYKDLPFQKAFMLIGEGANGKSVLINVLKEFLGEGNHTSIPLQSLAEDRFMAKELFNKMANLYPDLDKKGINSTGRFKALTGGDSLTIDRKFKSPMSFKNYCKLIFSANHIPRSSDLTYAYFRRWIIIDFPNTFNGKKKDIELLEKLITEEELSGLFNYAVLGLERILEVKGFTQTKGTEEIKKQYLRLSCSSDAFATECLEFSATEFTSFEKLEEVYINWCDKHVLPTEELRVLNKSVKKSIPQSRKTQKRKEHGGRGWQSVKIISSVDYENEVFVEEEYVDAQSNL